jgi:hypothetical protein
MNEWYGMPFIVPFALLLMEGAAVCLNYMASLVKDPEATLTAMLSAACVVAIAVWLTAAPPGPHGFLEPRGGTKFLFARPAVTRGAGISTFFASMPRDTGIMAPQGLSPEVAYLTDKRVVALPFDPELLDRFIEEYRVAYLLVSSEHMSLTNSPAADRYTSRLVTRFIVQHPEKYRLVSSLAENYPDFYPPSEYFVLEVPKHAPGNAPR